MSCRSTNGGSASLRLARAYSGLDDSSTQVLFHALKREGHRCPPPTEKMKKEWLSRQRILLKHANLSESQRVHTEKELRRAMSEKTDGGSFHAWQRIEVRARQEIVLNSVADKLIDLQPPGSQSDQYILGEKGRPTKVWYASYGSNLSKQRFLTYIQGGTPEGSNSAHPGCRNKTLPESDIPIRFNGRLHFSGTSMRWGCGGVAFMDNEDNLGRSLGRAYLIDMEQFDDVVAQENGRSVGAFTVKTDEAIINGSSLISSGSLYGTMVHIGDYQGIPVFTFTGDFSAEDALVASRKKDSFGYTSVNKPSPNYIRIVASGLADTLGLTSEQQVDYLRGALGAESFTRTEMKAIIESPADIIEPPKRTYPTFDSSSYLSGGRYGYESYRPTRAVRDPSEPWGYPPPSRYSDPSYDFESQSLEDQITDLEFEEDLKRYSEQEDPDIPWFNDPAFNKSLASSIEEYDISDGFRSPRPKNPRGCEHCHETDHYTFECLVIVNRIKSEQNRKNAESVTKNSENKDSSSLITYRKYCVMCSGYGHSMHDCPKMTEDSEPVEKKIKNGFLEGFRKRKEKNLDEPMRVLRKRIGDEGWQAPSREAIDDFTTLFENAGLKPSTSEFTAAVWKTFGVYSIPSINQDDLLSFLDEYEDIPAAELKAIFAGKEKTLGKKGKNKR